MTSPALLLLSCGYQSTLAQYETDERVSQPKTETPTSTTTLHVDLDGFEFDATDSVATALKPKDTNNDSVLNDQDYDNPDQKFADVAEAILPKDEIEARKHNVTHALYNLSNTSKYLHRSEAKTRELDPLFRDTDLLGLPVKGPLTDDSQCESIDVQLFNLQYNFSFDATTKLISAFLYLTDSLDAEYKYDPLFSYCNDLHTFKFDESKIPPAIYPAVQELLTGYHAQARWLEGGLDTSICDTDPAEKRHFNSVRFEASDKTALVQRSCGGGGCFDGSILLKTVDSTISFDDMITLQKTGLPLPAVASFDENTGTTVFQTPDEVLEHTDLAVTYFTFDLTNPNGDDTSLRVTGNHQLLVLRGGDLVWTKAQDININTDSLAGENDETYFINGVATQEATETVYNLSFYDQPEHEGAHTYLVSEDGENWVVAHNLKI